MPLSYNSSSGVDNIKVRNLFTVCTLFVIVLNSFLNCVHSKNCPHVSSSNLNGKTTLSVLLSIPRYYTCEIIFLVNILKVSNQVSKTIIGIIVNIHTAITTTYN